MADPQVMAHLQTLELDVHEGTALFHLLDNGDGEALRPSTAREEYRSRLFFLELDSKI